jgi:NTE family protein
MEIEKPNIKHIVLSGGSVWGLYQYGAIKQLYKDDFWNYKNIESIYGSSVGSLIAVILCLKIDFEIVDKYIIERPWNEVFKKHSYNLLETYDNRGIFHKQLFYDFFSPLFKSCDIETKITITEFYEKTGIELHIFLTELNSFESIDISYKTNGDWNVIDAVYASCSIPTIFAPIIIDNKCYIDGGFLNNYPLKKCLENIENIENKDTILGISIGNTIEEEEVKTIINKDSNFLDFVSVLLNRIFKNLIFANEDAGIIKYEICFFTKLNTLYNIMNVISSKEEREKMIEIGCKKAKKFYNVVCTNLSNESAVILAS